MIKSKIRMFRSLSLASSQSSSFNENDPNRQNTSKKDREKEKEKEKELSLKDKDSPIVKSGFLDKQADHLKTWKARFMVLKGNSLFYYCNSKDVEPKGIISLLNVKVQFVDFSRFKKKFCFEISSESNRPIYLVAENNDVMMEWVSCILAATIPVNQVGHAVWPVNSERYVYIEGLKDAKKHMLRLLLRRKISMCCQSARFGDPTDSEFTQKKQETLEELISYYESNRNILASTNLYGEALAMVAANVFRCFPPKGLDASIILGGDEEDDVLYSDPSWTHLRLVYDFLLLLVDDEIVPRSVKRSSLNRCFISQVMGILDSQDIKEREVAKNILHRIYYRFTQDRLYIRTRISQIFLEYIYDEQSHCGISELLEILGSIINGFASPIKLEHITLLKKTMIPLHSTPHYVEFHPQLSYCMLQYAAKDGSLVVDLIMGLLKYWPVGNSYKEVLFLSEIEELFVYASSSNVDRVYLALCRQLCRCIECPHFQVAERALSLYLNRDLAWKFFFHSTRAAEIREILMPSIVKASNHWSSNVKSMATRLLTVMTDQEKDPACDQNVADDA